MSSNSHTYIINSIILITILFAPLQGKACVCDNFNFHPDLDTSHLNRKYFHYITGKVERISKIKRVEEFGYRKQPLSFYKVVIKVRKNYFNKRKKIIIYTHTALSACGYKFEEGASYLITFCRSENVYKTSVCLPVKQLENAVEDLKLLNKRKVPLLDKTT